MFVFTCHIVGIADSDGHDGVWLCRGQGVNLSRELPCRTFSSSVHVQLSCKQVSGKAIEALQFACHMLIVFDSKAR